MVFVAWRAACCLRCALRALRCAVLRAFCAAAFGFFLVLARGLLVLQVLGRHGVGGWRGVREGVRGGCGRELAGCAALRRTVKESARRSLAPAPAPSSLCFFGFISHVARETPRIRAKCPLSIGAGPKR